MPGVLIIEAMAQVAGVLVLSSIPDRKNKLVLLAGVDGAKFRKPVRPGDQLRMEMKVLRSQATMAKMSARRPSTAWWWPRPKCCASWPTVNSHRDADSSDCDRRPHRQDR